MKKKKAADNFIRLADPVLQRLEEAGYEAWLVGGCVREILLPDSGGMSGGAVGGSEGGGGSEETATDLDVTTSAAPEEVIRIFEDFHVIETGIKHGTVTVMVPSESVSGGAYPVEVTTFRTESGYSDGRHPDEVRFVTSLEEDLRRRDFTVNAMAMDRRGHIADPFGGQEDLEKGILRAVGDPRLRFQEDALRILRALRFASVLDFQIEEATEIALFENRNLLRAISAERVFVELKKLVCGKAAGKVLRGYADIPGAVIPELSAMKGFQQNNPYHRYDVLEHCIRAMEEIRTTPENRVYMKLAALFHDVGKPGTYSEDENGIGHFYGHPGEGAKIMERILRRLKSDRFTMERITTLVRYHDLVFQEDPKLLKRWMNRYSPEILQEILEIKRADNIATGNVSDELLEKFARIELMIREILAGKDCFTIRDLAVNGRDLIACGLQRGPSMGRILQYLLDEVIDGNLPNEKNALLEAARKKS